MTKNQNPPITRDGIDTRSDGDSSGREAPVTVGAVLAHPSADAGMPQMHVQRYGAAMTDQTTTASSVLAAIDARKPGLKPAKKHLLLFFAQGHYLAWADTPLFGEPMIATERGITVEIASTDSTAEVPPNAMLVTIGQVVTRYAQLSAAELRLLIYASQPWQDARKPDASPYIDLALLRDWFLRDDETDDPDDERPNRAERAEVEAYLASQRQP